MVRYDEAVAGGGMGAEVVGGTGAEHETGAEREDARDWLVAYNRGDVEATLALRDWLGDERPTPSIEEAVRGSGTSS